MWLDFRGLDFLRKYTPWSKRSRMIEVQIAAAGIVILGKQEILSIYNFPELTG